MELWQVSGSFLEKSSPLSTSNLWQNENHLWPSKSSSIESFIWMVLIIKVQLILFLIAPCSFNDDQVLCNIGPIHKITNIVPVQTKMTGKCITGKSSEIYWIHQCSGQERSSGGFAKQLFSEISLLHFLLFQQIR